MYVFRATGFDVDISLATLFSLAGYKATGRAQWWIRLALGRPAWWRAAIGYRVAS